MNKTLIVWLSGATIALVSARGQGSFQNLDFEAAHDLPTPGHLVATSNALPAWSAFSGTNLLPTIPYGTAAGVPQVGLNGSNEWVITGNFTVMLGRDGSISQTGLVPADAESLLFKGRWTGLSSLGVSLGGQSLSYTTISSGPNYTLYGVDISDFAGQAASLVFSAATPSLYFLVDDVQFSPQAVPEASTLALFGLGSVCIAMRLLGRRRSKRRVKSAES